MTQKALNIFNAAVISAAYYVFFTGSTFVTSAVLFRGFKATPIAIATIVLSFAQISGSVLSLQASTSGREERAIQSGLEAPLTARLEEEIGGAGGQGLRQERYDEEIDAAMGQTAVQPMSMIGGAQQAGLTR